ncbi:DsrH/TusB family sulfur relay protein [Marinomonas algarum]|uniref:DsrH/TusB family sulfur relay protein n=1 Tax=Marinomonas algarum TaxID=2883105 RepID=A0A9X1LBG0_9GAMM|nr:DsrH/TusB family sulfur relay protein [Marinomonas algarum]MCB5160799.1 DsrH/TusB family sulfur relay protein [Marinomonas algarum]
MQLHQINQSEYPVSLETLWQNSLQVGDQVMLIEEGVLRLTQDSQAMQTLIKEKNVTLYYLQSDALAYGLSPSIGTPLSDAEWVTLTFQAEKNISW